jgi:hypothetical protein
MMETKEFAKSDLLAIVEQLEMCGYTCEGGLLENNVAFIELRRIANDRHDVAACLVNYWHGLGITKSESYITPDDIGKPIQDNQVVKVTLEYVPMSETVPRAED